MLFFDAPISTATYVDLELSGKNVGLGKTKIKLRLALNK